MPQFDSKTFNAEVFGKYLERVPRVKQDKLLEAGVLRPRRALRALLGDHAGGNYITVPMLGLIDGEPLNYDGETDLTAVSTRTYAQSMVVVGRMKAWEEKDFAADITGADFMDNVAMQVAEYWDGVDEDTLLAILKGVFAMSGEGNAEFVDRHTYDVTAAAEPYVGATTLNSAIQRAAGANKGIFRVVVCHSAVSTNLENLAAVEYLKYTDKRGVTRDLGLASWNGRLLLVDDGVGVEQGYYAAEEGDEGALAIVADSASPTGAQVKLGTVTAAAFSPAGAAAGQYVVPGERYCSYILGEGAFDFCDCGARTPNEMWRDPRDAGGKDVLITRQRKLFAPRGLSFTKASMNSLSPTNAELENGANWALVNDGQSDKGFIDHRAIPIARILSRG